MLANLEDEILAQAGDATLSAGEDYAKRAAIKQGAGLGCAILGPFVAACEGVISVYNAVDAVITAIGTLIDVIDIVSDIGGNIKAMNKALEMVKEIKETLGDPEKTKELKKKLLENMKKEAKENNCLQARKCMLVPYKKTKQGKLARNETAQGLSGNISTLFGLGDSRGCCPGQTGHHLVPGSWVRKICNKYNHKEAPVVCMEGLGHSDGTHGEMHTGMNKAFDALSSGTVKEYDDGLQKLTAGKNTVTIDNAIDMAIQSHQEVYPDANQGYVYDSPCEPKCLKAQLKNYYDKMNCNKTLDAKKIGRDKGPGTDESGR